MQQQNVFREEVSWSKSQMCHFSETQQAVYKVLQDRGLILNDVPIENIEGSVKDDIFNFCLNVYKLRKWKPYL